MEFQIHIEVKIFWRCPLIKVLGYLYWNIYKIKIKVNLIVLNLLIVYWMLLFLMLIDRPKEMMLVGMKMLLFYNGVGITIFRHCFFILWSIYDKPLLQNSYRACT